MGNRFLSRLSKAFDSVVSKFGERETPLTDKLKLADILEKYLIESHVGDTTELQDLIDAYRAKTPSIEELQPIENGYDIVEKYDFFLDKRPMGSSVLKLLGDEAGNTLERDHGIISKSSRKIAGRFIGENQENTPSPSQNNLMAYKERIEKIPDTDRSDMMKTTLKIIAAIDDISRVTRPSQDNLEALINATNNTSHENLSADLVLLCENTAPNLISFLDKEAKPAKELDTLTP